MTGETVKASKVVTLIPTTPQMRLAGFAAVELNAELNYLQQEAPNSMREDSIKKLKEAVLLWGEGKLDEAWFVLTGRAV